MKIMLSPSPHQLPWRWKPTGCKVLKREVRERYWVDHAVSAVLDDPPEIGGRCRQHALLTFPRAPVSG